MPKDTISLSLGYAPAKGTDAATQCLFFKSLMRMAIGRDPDGAYLHINGVGSRGAEMVVEYSPDTPGALEWAKKAQERAEYVWEQVAGRQLLPKERIIARSRGA